MQREGGGEGPGVQAFLPIILPGKRAPGAQHDNTTTQKELEGKQKAKEQTKEQYLGRTEQTPGKQQAKSNRLRTQEQARAGALAEAPTGRPVATVVRGARDLQTYGGRAASSRRPEGGHDHGSVVVDAEPGTRS